MQSLRNAHRLIRFVLVWFALTLGVAMASPVVHPQITQLVCAGAGTVKVLASGEGDAAASVVHTLDCPLCVVGAVLVSVDPAQGHTQQPSMWLHSPAVDRPAWDTVSLQPPPRGPPSFV